jgi:hypothetical protein
VGRPVARTGASSAWTLPTISSSRVWNAARSATFGPLPNAWRHTTDSSIPRPAAMDEGELHWLPCRIEGEDGPADVRSYFVIGEQMAAFRGRRLRGTAVSLPDGWVLRTPDGQSFAAVTVWGHDEPDRSAVASLSLALAYAQLSRHLSS